MVKAKAFTRRGNAKLFRRTQTFYSDRRTGRRITHARFDRLAVGNRRRQRVSWTEWRSTLTGHVIQPDKIRKDPARQRIMEALPGEGPRKGTDARVTALQDLSRLFAESVMDDEGMESFSFENYFDAAKAILSARTAFTKDQINAAEAIVSGVDVSILEKRRGPSQKE